jgi:predicted nucleic acid-binding protein
VNGLLDTSAVIAIAAGQSLTLPDAAAISAMTLAELHVGVLRAKTSAQRAGRVRTVAVVERELEVLPIESASHAASANSFRLHATQVVSPESPTR